MNKVFKPWPCRRYVFFLGALTACSNHGGRSGEPSAIHDGSPLSSQSSLRELAGPLDFEIGTAFDGWQFEDSSWSAVVEEEFNLGVINWGVYWAEIEASEGALDFEIPDRQVAFAESKGLKMRGQPLVFPEAFPTWLENGSFSDEELLTLLQNHITRVVSRYRGRISQWIVVNEPYLYPYRKEDIFYRRFGYEYIEFAFEVARQADPAATLIYNDTDNHYPTSATTSLTQQIVATLSKKDLIDGVGLQMHLDAGNPPNKQEVIATMRNYGVVVYVTEFDVDLRNVSTNPNKYLLQAQIYNDMLEACVESGVCKSFTVWDTGDKFSWLEWPENEPFTSPQADPTPFDDYLQPKPAYSALQSVLLRYGQ